MSKEVIRLLAKRGYNVEPFCCKSNKFRSKIVTLPVHSGRTFQLTFLKCPPNKTFYCFTPVSTNPIRETYSAMHNAQYTKKLKVPQVNGSCILCDSFEKNGAASWDEEN